MSAPFVEVAGPSQGSTSKRLERTVSTTQLSETAREFLIRRGVDARQFAALYFARLNLLKLSIITAVRSNSNVSKDVRIMPKVTAAVAGERCVLIGTLYKQMKRMPSILEAYSKTITLGMREGRPSQLKEQKKNFDPYAENYVSDDDTISLEDSHGRVQLRAADAHKTSTESKMEDDQPASSSGSGKTTLALLSAVCGGVSLPISALCAGSVVAVVGMLDAETDEFVVEGCMLPGLPASSVTKGPSASSWYPRVLPSPSQGTDHTPSYVALLSDVQMGSPPSNSVSPLCVQLLVDYLTGRVGGRQDGTLQSRISRLVVCGNLVSPPKERGKADFLYSRQERAARKRAMMQPLLQADVMLSQLCAVMPVHLMPGDSDPADRLLPQQPLHRFLFPRAARHNTFTAHTNPTWITAALPGSSDAPVGLAGSSGQPLRDMAQVTSGRSRLELLADCAMYRCLAPTAPDQTSCYPFQHNDPFVLRSAPSVMFAGCQPTFQTGLLGSADSAQRLRLVCVPSFSKTAQLVLVDIADPNMHTQVISFKVGM